MAPKSTSCCAITITAIFECVVLAAALLAIGSTYWLQPQSGVLPGIKSAGLWRVCYTAVDPQDPLKTSPGPDASMAVVLQTSSSRAGAAGDALRQTTTNGSGKEPAASTTVVNDQRLNATKIVSQVREDLKSNFPFISSDSKGCSKNMTLYDNIWGENYSLNLEATRALSLSFAVLSVVKLVSMLCCGCGSRRSSGFPRFIGMVTTVQVLVGWIAWLVYLWIILGIKDSRGAREAVADFVDIPLTKAADPSSYWGHSFWLFLASTVVACVGSFFVCC